MQKRPKKSIQKLLNISGKRVLLRLDLDVPIKDGSISNDFRLRGGVPTINYLKKEGAKIIICGHLGRPAGRKVKKLSLQIVAKKLESILGYKVKFLDNISDFSVGTVVGKMKRGDIVMLENLRFYKGEEKNDKNFAKGLARLADIYVNDAFSVSHRSHASVSSIKSFLPSYSGLLLEKEIFNLNKIILPKKPLVSIMGGSKISTKIKLIKELYKKSSYVLVGGVIANNFLAAKKINTGLSVTDRNSIKIAKNLLGPKIILPIDVIVKNRYSGNISVKNVLNIEKGDTIFDIGPKTIALYAGIIKKAKSLIWNGPLGLYEVRHFRLGSLAIAQTVAARSKGSAFGVVGGGETVDVLSLSKMDHYVDWISSGGGAMLAYLGEEQLPGLNGLFT